jgi:hypothetical protein
MADTQKLLSSTIALVGGFTLLEGFVTALLNVFGAPSVYVNSIAWITVSFGVITLLIAAGYNVAGRQLHKLFDLLFLAEVSAVVFPAIWRDRTNGLGFQHALDDNFDAAYEYACRKYSAYSCRPDDRGEVKSTISGRMRYWGGMFDEVITDAAKHPEVLRLVPSSAKGGIMDVATEYSSASFEGQADR